MTDLIQRYVLPWPPSVNHYWKNTRRHGRPSRALTRAAEKFRVDAIDVVIRRNGNRRMERIAGQLDVTVIHHWPDKRVRDVDNYSKGILDALTHAGVWFDDQQVRNLQQLDGVNVRGGCVVVEIRECATQPREFQPDG